VTDDEPWPYRSSIRSYVRQARGNPDESLALVAGWFRQMLDERDSLSLEEMLTEFGVSFRDLLPKEEHHLATAAGGYFGTHRLARESRARPLSHG
jgi:hypothetical protein